MRYTKEHAAIAGMFFVVLYASNTATGFFAKQGYVPVEQLIGLSRQVIMPRVEQYQRSTLMGADLIEELDLLQTKTCTAQAGDAVEVECGLRRTTTEAANIVEISACKRKLKVHFKKWSPEFDEWIVVAAKRLSIIEQPPVKRIRITFRNP